jgi:hypothetical protein
VILRIHTIEYSGGTVGTATGVVLDEETGEETGQEATIGVDHRPLRDLADLLEEGEQVVAHAEDWQVLRVVGSAQEG